MKIACLSVAGSVLVSATTASPLDLLIRDIDVLNQSTLTCIQNIEYNPLHDSNSALDWCTDKNILDRLNDCTMKSCSSSTEEFLASFKQWCNTASITLPPNQFYCKRSLYPEISTSKLSDGIGLNAREMPNLFHKRYISSDSDSSFNISPGAVIGILLGVGLVLIALMCSIRGCNGGRRAFNAQGPPLPLYEPPGGRPASARQSRTPDNRPTARTRTPSPPPPYIAEPEHAHLKDGPNQQELPSYEGRPQGH